jgi:hypothetical protein
MPPLSSGSKNIKARNQRDALLATCFMLVCYLAYSSTLKMETCSSETSIDFQRSTRRYIPEDKPIHLILPGQWGYEDGGGMYSWLWWGELLGKRPVVRPKWHWQYIIKAILRKLIVRMRWRHWLSSCQCHTFVLTGFKPLSSITTVLNKWKFKWINM